MKGLWQVLACPDDDLDTAYLVSNHPNRSTAYAERARLEAKDPRTIFVVLMVIVEDDELDGLESNRELNGRAES